MRLTMRAILSIVAVSVLAVPALAAPSAAPTEASVQDLKAVDHFVTELEQEWRHLDRACSTDAAFALTYLITSKGVRDHIAASHFDDNPFVAEWDLIFAAYYMDALDARLAGASVSAPWREAFAWGDSGQSTVTEDLLLGMSAHINYDLALATYEAGLVRDGRKADYDRINDALASVVREILVELARHYDPSLAPGAGNDLTDPVVLEMIFQWRENAWWNAVRLEAATTGLEREVVRQTIEAEALVVAESLQVPKESTTAGRVAYCEGDP